MCLVNKVSNYRQYLKIVISRLLKISPINLLIEVSLKSLHLVTLMSLLNYFFRGN